MCEAYCWCLYALRGRLVKRSTVGSTAFTYNRNENAMVESRKDHAGKTEFKMRPSEVMQK